MELKRISYMSAIFFGVLSILLAFLLGLLKFLLSKTDPVSVVMMFGTPFLALNDLLKAPLFNGAMVYISLVVTILIYNLVAKKYPISWTVKK